MTKLCRVCLTSSRDVKLYSLLHARLREVYEKLSNSKFNQDGRSKAVCSFCYQKLLRCYTFSRMAVSAENIFRQFSAGIEVTHEDFTAFNRDINKQLSVAPIQFFTFDGNATNATSQVTVDEEPLPSNDTQESRLTFVEDISEAAIIFEEDYRADSQVTVEEDPLPSIDTHETGTSDPDKLLVVESFPAYSFKSRLTFEEDISDRENDTEEVLSVDTKEDVTTILDKLVGPFPERSSKNRITFEEDNSDQENDAEEFLDKIHVEQITPDKSKMLFICNNCEKIFDMKSKLIRHILFQHTGATCIIKDKRKHNLNNKFACHLCNKTLNLKRSLRRHLRTHTGEKPFACKVCGKQFSQKCNLVQHMTIHTGEKPFACNVCDKQFNKKFNLLKHMTIHTGEKPFACNVCDKKFNQKGNLVKHMRTHTGDKPFACNVCDKQFSQKCNLVHHIMTIHKGEKPFACNECDKQFTRKDQLVSHMRTHARQKRQPKRASPRGRKRQLPSN